MLLSSFLKKWFARFIIINSIAQTSNVFIKLTNWKDADAGVIASLLAIIAAPDDFSRVNSFTSAKLLQFIIGAINK